MVGLHWGWGEVEGGCQPEGRMRKEKEKKKGKEEVEEDGLKKKEGNFLNFPHPRLSVSPISLMMLLPTGVSRLHSEVTSSRKPAGLAYLYHETYCSLLRFSIFAVGHQAPQREGTLPAFSRV